MSKPTSLPMERSAARFVMAITFFSVFGGVLAVAVADLRAARALHGVGSTRTYAPDGRVLSAKNGDALPSGLALRLALRLQPPEITCNRTESGGTECTESSPAPLAQRLALWLPRLGIAAVAAAVLAILAGAMLRRLLTRRFDAMAAVLDRGVRERDYSLRVAEAGPFAASVNALLGQMQERDVALRRRTGDLEAANKELESFAYAVSHDLRAPLGSIDGFAQALAFDFSDQLEEGGRECVHWIREAARQMRELIEGLLQMSQLTRAELSPADVNLSSIARHVAGALQQRTPERHVTFRIRDGVHATGDERLLRAVVENLMGNAWKFTRGRDDATIEFGMKENGGTPAYYVRDNGAGFDPAHAARMFRPFQRLHSQREFEGSGIGLATVQKIVLRHGGQAWAEGDVGKGATIYFTTGAAAHHA